MNKWFRRAVGTVGIAGGVLLLGSGTAHADNSVPAAKDPQQLHGLFDDLLKPAGGPNNAGLSLDTPGRRMSAGLVPGGPIATSAHRGPTGAVVHTPDRAGLPKDPFVSAPVPGVLGALPISDVSRTSGLGGLGAPAPSALARACCRRAPSPKPTGRRTRRGCRCWRRCSARSTCPT